MTTLQPAESANKLSATTVIKDKLMSHDYSAIKPKWKSKEDLCQMIFLVPHGLRKLLIKSESWCLYPLSFGPLNFDIICAIAFFSFPFNYNFSSLACVFLFSIGCCKKHISLSLEEKGEHSHQLRAHLQEGKKIGCSTQLPAGQTTVSPELLRGTS